MRNGSGVRAKDQGRLLRRKYGLTGQVDAVALAEVMGLRVDLWHLPAKDLHEATRGRNIAVAADLDAREQRWAVAHGIGHRILHPGNHLWLRATTMLAVPYERQTEQFTFGLLVDEAEVKADRLLTLAEVAGRFGVPMHMLWEHGPELWGQTRLW